MATSKDSDDPQDESLDSGLSETSEDPLVPKTVVEPGLGDEPSEGETRRLKDRIASSLREGDPMGAGAAVLSSMPISGLREYWLLFATAGVLVTILITFRTVLLPFVLALALVYLMEPLVGWIGKSDTNPKRLPRWAAVILVYGLFIGIVTTSVVLVIPRFITEIVGLAETVPQEIQKFRTQRLPGVNEKVQRFLSNYLPVAPIARDDIQPAQEAIRAARIESSKQAIALGNAKATVRFGYDFDIVLAVDAVEGDTVGTFSINRRSKKPVPFSMEMTQPESGWTISAGPEDSTIQLTPNRDGGLSVNLNEVAIEVEEVGEKRWVLRKQETGVTSVEDAGVSIDKLFNLEKTIDDLLQDFAVISNERLAQVIDFVQKFVFGVVGAFVGLILTLMVAAFISMDLPRMMTFIRGFVPNKGREGYDILIERMDRGLAGVVRGQLLICVINGILTWIGLYLLDVKFQVLLAVLAGILSLIPVFGTVVSTIPICLIALTSGLSTGVLALLWILLIHAVEANFLNPKIIGSSAHIHPVIVIFALLAGESAFGLVGALLAVPTASIVLTLFEFIRTRAWNEAASLKET